MSDEFEPEVQYGPEEPAPTPPAPPAPPSDDSETKSLADVAKEVVEGKWGVGQDRRLALADAGIDPNEVQEEVRKLLNPPQ